MSVSYSLWFIWLCILAMSTRKLISCSSCNEEHPPRGGSFCVYTREARLLCATLAVSENEFILHLDHEKIKNDSRDYLALNDQKDIDTLPTDITRDLIEKLIAENAASRESQVRQETQMNALLAGFEKLLISRSGEESHEQGAGAGVDRDSSTADRLLALLTDQDSKDKSTAGIFRNVTKIPHDPVLQKHTTSTHFTPLVHGHRPLLDRASVLDRRDEYYDDRSPPRTDYRATERRKRRLWYFDLDVHMTFDSKSTDFRTFEDVLSANLSLVDSLLTQGYSVTCYLKHIQFLVDKSKVYTSSSLIRYDQAVRERADILGENTMVYGDHELVHRFLGPENLKPRGKSVSHDSAKTNVKVENKRKLPVGLCWKWNFGKKCANANCNLKHVCTECFGNHRNIDCSTSEARGSGTLAVAAPDRNR